MKTEWFVLMRRNKWIEGKEPLLSSVHSADKYV